MDDSNARNPLFGDLYEGAWQRVQTFDPAAETCRFSIFNDIHMQLAEYGALAAQFWGGELDLCDDPPVVRDVAGGDPE